MQQRPSLVSQRQPLTLKKTKENHTPTTTLTCPSKRKQTHIPNQSKRLTTSNKNFQKKTTREKKKMLTEDKPPNHFLSLTPLLLLLLLVTTLQAKAATFMYAGCSPAKYDPNTPYQTDLIALLSTIITSSSQVSYNNFATGTDSSAAAYGLYQCRNDLSLSDCTACIQSAVNQLSLVCPLAFTASLQLDWCFIRYSHEDFRGKLETDLVYKKCSQSTSYDGEFFRRRDDVISDLQAAAGFRVSRSGTVQGYAQCLGDLNAGDCKLCMSQAVGHLKVECGSALAADVFLAKCYARYWASGYYLQSNTEDSGDDIGRTIAIVVGIVAGLAIIVIFISFLKRAC